MSVRGARAGSSRRGAADQDPGARAGSRRRIGDPRGVSPRAAHAQSGSEIRRSQPGAHGELASHACGVRFRHRAHHYRSSVDTPGLPSRRRRARNDFDFGQDHPDPDRAGARRSRDVSQVCRPGRGSSGQSRFGGVGYRAADRPRGVVPRTAANGCVVLRRHRDACGRGFGARSLVRSPKSSREDRARGRMHRAPPGARDHHRGRELQPTEGAARAAAVRAHDHRGRDNLFDSGAAGASTPRSAWSRPRSSRSGHRRPRLRSDRQTGRNSDARCRLRA